MKKLHNPGTPCKIERKGSYNLSGIIGNKLEAVKCSEGWGLFGNGEFWVSDEELKELRTSRSIGIFNPSPFNLNGWGFYSPINLEIELTKKCNQQCIHCWNESGKDTFIQNDILKEIINEFRSYGGQRLKITGGEPLEYFSLFDFLAYSKSQGVKTIELTTNGSLINEGTAKDLSKYVSRINISLHGATEETHNKITRSQNYHKTKKAIEFCNQYGLETIINFTVMEENKKEVKEIFKIAKNYGNKIRFNLLMQRGFGKELRDISPEIFQLRKAISNLSKLYNVPLEKSDLYPIGYNLNIEFYKFYGCGALRDSMYISSKGLALPCNLATRAIGDIYEDSVREIWGGEKAKEIRKITLCEKDLCTFSCSGKCKAKRI
ncbi:MAG: radical SAM protein [Nanoarchaeota archaeon]|nr:radical SAM protein [Nanoarchaeota archaeon]